MDRERLIEIIAAAGYTPEPYTTKRGKLCHVSVQINTQFKPQLAILANMARKCATVEEASDLVQRASFVETPTSLTFYWSHTDWMY